MSERIRLTIPVERFNDLTEDIQKLNLRAKAINRKLKKQKFDLITRHPMGANGKEVIVCIEFPCRVRVLWLELTEILDKYREPVKVTKPVKAKPEWGVWIACGSQKEAIALGSHFQRATITTKDAL